MEYETAAEAHRDLKLASGRLALAGRLAALLALTPAVLLPTVCYLCQGLIAPPEEADLRERLQAQVLQRPEDE